MVVQRRRFFVVSHKNKINIQPTSCRIWVALTVNVSVTPITVSSSIFPWMLEGIPNAVMCTKNKNMV